MKQNVSMERKRWIAETKAAVADGSMRERIESQPSPEEIVEQEILNRKSNAQTDS
jgi:hypothetical protein